MLFKSVEPLRFSGVNARPSFNDASKIIRVGQFVKGVDAFRPYIEENQYNELVKLEEYTKVNVTIDLNPVTGRVSLHSWEVLK